MHSDMQRCALKSRRGRSTLLFLPPCSAPGSPAPSLASGSILPWLPCARSGQGPELPQGCRAPEADCGRRPRLSACGQGKLHLLQERHGHADYPYWAVARVRPIEQVPGRLPKDQHSRASAPMTSDRYVSTQAIHEAVKGRETEVLDGLGILWREARPHLRCPYPEHADEDPSWRWEEKRAKARCTCTRGDSIFDVVMKVEGADLRSGQAARRRDPGPRRPDPRAHRRAALPGDRCGEPTAATSRAARRRSAARLSRPSARRHHRGSAPPRDAARRLQGARLLRPAAAGQQGQAETGRPLSLRGLRHRGRRRPAPCAADLCGNRRRRQGRPRHRPERPAPRPEEVGQGRRRDRAPQAAPRCGATPPARRT